MMLLLLLSLSVLLQVDVSVKTKKMKCGKMSEDWMKGQRLNMQVATGVGV